MGVFKNARQNIIRMLDDLEMIPNTSFERDIVCEEEDSFMLSTENMKSLKHYHDEVCHHSTFGLRHQWMAS